MEWNGMEWLPGPDYKVTLVQTRCMAAGKNDMKEDF